MVGCRVHASFASKTKTKPKAYLVYSDSNSAVGRHLTRQHKHTYSHKLKKKFKRKQIIPINSEIIRKALIEFRIQSTPEEVNVVISEHSDCPPTSTSSATTSITTMAYSSPGPSSSSLSPVSNLALSSPPSTPFNVEAPVDTALCPNVGCRIRRHQSRDHSS